ncbi:MAG: hypothetical protein ACLPN1_14620 [Dissulfurispiraceae bacterium]|jgi:hypothetical protein
MEGSIEKSYSLYLSKFFIFFVCGILGMFVIMGIAFILGFAGHAKSDGPREIIGIIWLAIGLGNGYWILSVPHRIEVSNSGKIEFISIMKRKRFRPIEILSIRPQSGHVGFFSIKTTRGKITILNQFDGFHEFITDLKAQNPTVELHGC